MSEIGKYTAPPHLPSEKIRTLIVDDESLAVESLRALLAAKPEIEIIGECFNGGDAVSAIKSMRSHLVLLDVQVPVLDGFEVIEALEPEEIPVVVFITAFDQYAGGIFTIMTTRLEDGRWTT